MSITAESRTKLAEIRERAGHARKARTQARELLTVAKTTGDTQAEAVAQASFDNADRDVQVVEALENVMLSQISGVGTFGGTGRFGQDSFLDSPDTVAMLGRLAGTSQPVGRVELGSLQTPEQMCAMLDTGAWGPGSQRMAASVVPDSTVGRRGPFDELGVIQQPRRRLSVLDLIPSSPAIGNTVPYVVESGSFDTAAETAESAVKPVGDIGLTDGEAPIRTIAHFLKSPRQILADMPGLDAILHGRLTYAVLRHLESQAVSGDGTGQTLKGILNTSGIGSVAYAGGTPLADLSLAGLVAILNSEAEPDACVMNPTTLQSLLTPKASTAGMYLNIDSPFGTAPSTLALWGIPVITSTMMATNTVLFGSFSQGARLWIREAVNVVVGLDSDDLTRNRVTLLGEGRFGLTINVPAYFALVHLA